MQKANACMNEWMDGWMDGWVNLDMKSVFTDNSVKILVFLSFFFNHLY